MTPEEILQEEKQRMAFCERMVVGYLLENKILVDKLVLNWCASMVRTGIGCDEVINTLKKVNSDGSLIINHEQFMKFRNEQRRINELIKQPRIVSKYSRYQILQRQSWKCNMCGCELKYGSYCTNFRGKIAHIDHIHPYSKRASYNGEDINELNNLQALCPECNIGKTNQIKQ